MSERQPPDVGAQVKALRTERGLSMRALAERCDLSPNTISLIERRSTSPSVSTLHRLAVALNVPITAFFKESSEQLRVINSRPEMRTFTGSLDVRLESLGSGLEGQTLEPFLVSLNPGADSGDQSIVHDGHELVYCLEGVLNYDIDGEPYRLQAGESLLFEAHLPHSWRNPGSEVAVFLLVFQSGVPGRTVEHHFPA